MAKFRARSALGFTILLLSILILLWGIWPRPQQAPGIILSGPWRLILDAPSLVRVGDTSNIRLTLEEETGGQEQSGAATGAESARRVDLEQLENSDSPHILVEARLEMAGMAVAPSGAILQPLPTNIPVDFFWRARPAKAGEYSGTLWLYLQRTAGDGVQTLREPVLARQIEIKSRALFGLTGLQARALGMLGTLFGLSLLIFRRRPS
jgi:hypothetical protein